MGLLSLPELLVVIMVNMTREAIASSVGLRTYVHYARYVRSREE